MASDRGVRAPKGCVHLMPGSEDQGAALLDFYLDAAESAARSADAGLTGELTGPQTPRRITGNGGYCRRFLFLRR